MKKQLMAGLLSASMLLSITACAGNGANITSANNISSEINVNENDLALVELSDTDKENIGKALVSASVHLKVVHHLPKMFVTILSFLFLEVHLPHPQVLHVVNILELAPYLFLS